MTESERTEDDARLDALHPQRQKKTAYTFMQKYYHVGAYFQDKGQDGQDGIYSRNYNEPVGYVRIVSYRMRVCMYVCMRVCMYARMHPRVYMRTYIHVYSHVHLLLSPRHGG
eukprot:GHVU01007519.1.p4 GENE.GHVU01007519.1~~GHVU01007519.1.p4  ORF type:complete len:112 (+),score=8.17 GHVU01007519.1:107-442(+)